MTTPRYISEFDPLDLSNGLRNDLGAQFPQLLLDESDPLSYIADYIGQQLHQMVESANTSLDQAYEDQLDRIAEATNALARDQLPFIQRRVRELAPDAIHVSGQIVGGSTNTFNVFVAGDGFISLSAARRTSIQNILNADEQKPIWIRYIVNDINRTTWTVVGTVKYWVDQASPETQVRQQLIDGIPSLVGLGKPLYRSAVAQLAWIDGVTADIDIVGADLPGDNEQLVHIWTGDISLTFTAVSR